MPEPRFAPYLSVTWLCSVASGDSQCRWATWFKAHNKYDKKPDPNPGRLAQWNAEHNLELKKRVDMLKSEGWEVTIEDQNSFKVGKNVTLSGKADIVATRDDVARIEDIKTGRRRHKDYWQVLTYMYMLPSQKGFKERLKEKRIEGALLYTKTGEFWEIPPEELTEMAKELIISTVVELGEQSAPSRTPSVRECRYCDIPESDCNERMTEED